VYLYLYLYLSISLVINAIPSMWGEQQLQSLLQALHGAGSTYDRSHTLPRSRYLQAPYIDVHINIHRYLATSIASICESVIDHGCHQCLYSIIDAIWRFSIDIYRHLSSVSVSLSSTMFAINLSLSLSRIDSYRANCHRYLSLSRFDCREPSNRALRSI